MKSSENIVRSNVPKRPGLYLYQLNGSERWHQQVVYLHQGLGWYPECEGKLCVNNGEGPISVARMNRHWKFASTIPPQKPSKRIAGNVRCSTMRPFNGKRKKSHVSGSVGHGAK